MQHCHTPAGRAISLRIFVVVAALFLVGCGELREIGSPVEAGNRTLAEKIEDRGGVAIDAPEEEVQETPEALAFAERLSSGNQTSVNIETGPSGTPIYAGPGRAYQEVSRLGSGTDVVATGTQSGEWALIQFGDFNGWVNARRLTLEDLPEQEVEFDETLDSTTTTAARSGATLYGVRSSSVGVNIRSGPGVSSSVLTSAPRGVELVGTGRFEAQWIEVSYNGTIGWASGTIITELG